MSQTDAKLLEDLSAWMDGELPADEARFLERRLANDPALRAQWERWQLASAGLRGQALRRMPESLAGRIAQAVAEEPRHGRRWSWAAGIAAAVLAAALLPGVLGTGNAPRLPEPGPGLAERGAPAIPPEAGMAPVSPLPVGQDDALALDGEVRARPWPRSPLAQDDRAMEAYLVRHNAMMAADGLGGFMPYVDVVAHDAGATDDAEPRR